MTNTALDEFAAFEAANAPKTTVHPEDASRSSTPSNGSTTLHSNSASPPPAPRPRLSSNVDIPETSAFHANTGPKGVIADARSFETAKKRSFRQTLSALSHGTSPPLFGSKTKKHQLEYSREKSSSPDLSASSEDEDFMNKWRANRLDEMIGMKQQDLMSRRRSPSKRKYGMVQTVDPVGYLDAIEKVHKDTTVVVLIYDDESTTSAKVEDALDRIARKHNTVRFVKLHHLDAEMDEIAAPGILAYRGAECFANLVSIMNEVSHGDTVSETVLEDILLQHRIL